MNTLIRALTLAILAVFSAIIITVIGSICTQVGLADSYPNGTYWIFGGYALFRAYSRWMGKTKRGIVASFVLTFTLVGFVLIKNPYSLLSIAEQVEPFFGWPAEADRVIICAFIVIAVTILNEAIDRAGDFLHAPRSVPHRMMQHIVEWVASPALIGFGIYLFFTRYEDSRSQTWSDSDVAESLAAEMANESHPEILLKTTPAINMRATAASSATARKFPREWTEQIKRFENAPLAYGKVEESSAKEDPLKRGVIQLGYGTTRGEIHDAIVAGILPKGSVLPTKFTKAEADWWMENITIPTYDRLVSKVVKVPLTLPQRFALISFCHNLGKGNLSKMAAAKGRLNSGNYAKIPHFMKLYVNAGANKNVKGLVRRRSWEASLFSSRELAVATEREQRLAVN